MTFPDVCFSPHSSSFELLNFSGISGTVGMLTRWKIDDNI